MKFKNNFYIYALLIQCYALLSYEFSYDSNNKNNIPHVEMHVNSNTQPKNNVHFSGNIRTVADYSDIKTPIHCSFLYQASPQLQHYLGNTVAPLFYHSAITDHYYALPGYIYPQGLRQCLSENYNLGNLEPDIQVYNVDIRGSRSLTLRYTQRNGRPLTAEAKEEVLKHLYRLWAFPIKLEMLKEDGQVEIIGECPPKKSNHV